MANLKDIRKRITSVKNTQQITSAMKMVAAARLKKAQHRTERSRPYAEKMSEVLSNLAMRSEHISHPLLMQRPAEKVMLVTVTSDKGLCGAFNQNIIKATESFIREYKKKYKLITLTVIGKKGYDYFRKRRINMFKNYTGLSGKVDYVLSQNIAYNIKTSFLDESVDEIYILYNQFVSAMSQEVVFEKLLPTSPGLSKDGESTQEYVFEPEAHIILDDIIVKNLETQLFKALLESEASELGARMTAMNSATSNAEDMIDKLTLDYNRARQESITKELMEIVSGAEAL